MNTNTENNDLSLEELKKENARLQKENAKVNKRLDRISQQGDRQHKQFEKLNEKLGSYIDVIDDHVISVTVDKDKKILSISTAFSNVFGFKEKEVLNEYFGFLLNKDDLERLEVELHDTVASKLSWNGELRFKNKSDILVWTNTIITPNFDEDELVGFTFISEDISKEKELKKLKTEQVENQKYDQNMLEYMSSRSAALLQRTEKSFSYVLWIIFATIVWTIVWANYAELEELTRGSGKIIPSNQVKKIESFENAIIDEILVQEGDIVKEGQLLLRFNNIENSSTFIQNRLRLEELKAKSKRLEYESKLIKPSNAVFENKDNSNIMAEESNLYARNIKQLHLKTSAMDEKIRQKKSELSEASKKRTHLKSNYILLEQELKIKEAMAKERIISQIEFLQFQRQKNDLAQELNQIENEIKRARSSIQELKQNIKEVQLDFKNRSKTEYHEVLSEIERLSQMSNSLNNKLSRNEVYSPVNGVIKKMYVNTIGEVATAGSSLIEIVPAEEKLIAEVKVLPDGIAHLKLNQEAMMKFSAYDFNIYGGVRANISYISADTILDKDDNKNYYIIHLTMQKNYIGKESNPQYIKIGMVADVDIIHGKKTVMNYILKPILKAKQNALTEK